MAASINICQDTVGLLVICSDIISSEQQNELISYLDKALKRIDKNKFATIETIFNNLFAKNDFEADSQYRQIIDTDNGSLAGFLYQPNFHAVINVLKDFFTHCYYLSIILLGQQIDSSGSFILSDGLLSADHFHRLIDKDFPLVTRHFHLSLPFVSLPWLKFSSNFCQKHFESISIDDLSIEINNDQPFGEVFYQNFVDKVRRSTTHIDIYDKLIPRDRAGTIAFDEPNLYILYGQHGEASLFGIRGFVVLINGGFSRFPSYWNLIRGLQIIDTCILTHFDYDVFPGFQTIIHRKTIPSGEEGRSCKPDIGALFVNQTQRIRFQSSPTSKRVSNNKLSVNLSQNIDQFFHDVKKLNIDTFDLIKNITTNKPTIEPINLYKKIAFGSLDLYVLHPTSLPVEDEKMLAAIQKIPIRDQQPSPLVIPLHHWYSSCSLLVWTPTGKSSKDTLVRILYTGACPQTLVFEALTRARHLDVLHEVPQHATNRLSTTKTSASAHNLSKINSTTQKVKPSSAGTTIQSSSKANDLKSKPTSNNQPTKSDKVRLPLAVAPGVKRSSLTKSSTESQPNNRKSQISTSKSADLTHEKQAHDADSVHDTSGKTSSSSDLQNSYEKESTNSETSGDLQRPESILFTGDNEENFVESNAATPIDDLHCHRFPTDPMTISFVDGAPNTRNPFLDRTDNEREMEIIHHTITETNEQSLPSHQEIEPQGLPIDDEQKVKKVSIKKPSNSNARLSTTTISSASQVRKSKSNTLTGSIFYVDVAFIPYHGNEHYVDSEFFRRIRARYYVLNAVEINRLTLESLIDGKQQWDTQEKHPVTLVPTYDGDTLRQFFVANKARLAELNITIIAASIRCNVQYDDDGSPAQRLRFTSEN